MQDFLKFMPRMEELNQQAQGTGLSSSGEEQQRGLARKKKHFDYTILIEKKKKNFGYNVDSNPRQFKK